MLSVADDNGSLGFTTGGLKYVSKLSALGFDLYAYFSMNRTEIFLLIRIPRYSLSYSTIYLFISSLFYSIVISYEVLQMKIIFKCY